MSLIDQAFSKVYGQSKPAASAPTRETDTTDTTVTSTSRELLRDESRGRSRELYIHQPQVALRGLHAPHSSVAPASRSNADTIPPSEASLESMPASDDSQPSTVESSGRMDRSRLINTDREVGTWAEFCFEVHALPGMNEIDEALTRLERGTSSTLSLVQEMSRDRPSAAAPRESSVPMAETKSSTALQTESPSPAAVRTPSLPSQFVPAWEVDHFQLPTVCQRVRELLGRDLELALRSLHDPRPQVLWVSSIWPGEGRTTVAVVLAATLGACGFRTLLMQGDCRTTPLAHQLGVAAEEGWSPSDTEASVDVLSDRCVASVADRLTMLSSNSTPVGLADCLTSACSIANRLAPWFDFVVVDAPAGDNLLPRSMLGDSLIEILVQDVRRQVREGIVPYRSPASGSPSAARIVRNFSA